MDNYTLTLLHEIAQMLVDEGLPVPLHVQAALNAAGLLLLEN